MPEVITRDGQLKRHPFDQEGDKTRAGDKWREREQGVPTSLGRSEGAPRLPNPANMLPALDRNGWMPRAALTRVGV